MLRQSKVKSGCQAVTPSLDATVLVSRFGYYICGIRAGIGSLRIHVEGIQHSIMNKSIIIGVLCINRIVGSHDQFAQSPGIGSLGHIGILRYRLTCI